MKKSLRFILLAIILVGIIGITGCEDHQERYEDPPWLGGSSIETLEKRGNYTIFLELMEKANYTEPISKQLFTLFVPDDNAFRDYFQTAGISGVKDMTKDEAVQLFTLHVLRNPRTRFQLIYEYAWSELQGPDGEYASLFHRKPTPSTSIPYPEKVMYSPESMVGQDVLVYTGNKNVPLFTEEWFHDYGGADDGSDYLAMYPGSTWKKDYAPNMKGMNWHNAMVIPNPEIPDELEVRTSSGFIYFLDRVVPPMPSIEEYMIANKDKYGLFYDIMQRFADYTGIKIDEQKRVQYRKSYDLIFNLAEERSSSTNTAVPPQNMWTAFLPTDQVLQNYLDNTVLKYYPTIDDAPRVTLYYVLQTQLSGTLVVMSKLENGYFNAFGDATDLKPSDLGQGYMCSNGVVYESNKIMEPNVFTCVPGILFVDKSYSTLLFVLNKANMLSSLANPNSEVTLFATTNEGLEEYGVRYNETNDVIEFRSPYDGKWSNMRTTDLEKFAQDQIYNGSLSDFGGNGEFARMSSDSYIQFGDNKIMGAENQQFDNPSNVLEVEKNERNGYLVKVDKPVQTRWVVGQYLKEDKDVSKFNRLLDSSKLLNKRFRDPITREFIPALKFYAGDKNWTAFIPTNAAMDEAVAAGIIPESWPSETDEQEKVKAFLQYHFVKGSVIFDDGKSSGNFNTNLTYTSDDGKTLSHKIKVTNSPGNLVLTDVSGNEITVEHENANILTRKGVVHKINSVLKYYE